MGVEIARKEVAHHGVVFHIVEHVLQKGVRSDEVDPQIAAVRAQDAVPDVSVEEEDVSAVQFDPLPADHVRHAPRVHVHELHIVVPVLGEVDKTRVQAKIDLLSAAEQFAAAHDERIRLGVVVPADALPSL